MILDIRPCRRAREPIVGINVPVVECALEHADFFGLFRCDEIGSKTAKHVRTCLTRDEARAAMDFELRCQAYEAEGLARGHAHALTEMEMREPYRRKTAHGLPPELAAAGFRIEFGDENYVDGTEPNPLRGKWWWTWTAQGDIDSSDNRWPAAVEAVADAQRAFDAGYDIDDDLWEDARSVFGLDDSFEYSATQKRGYIADMLVRDGRFGAMEQLLKDAVAHEARAFESDEPVDGADLVQWFSEFRVRAQRVLGNTEG